MRILLGLIVVASFGCGAKEAATNAAESFASAGDDLWSTAGQYCDCLPSANDADQCLGSITSMDDAVTCIQMALELTDDGADITGFVDCYEGAIAAAENCIGADDICDPERISDCIALTGVYNCDTPARLQTFIDDCLQ